MYYNRVVVYLTLLTDPLQIQPWSHDKRNPTRSSWEHVRRKKQGKQRTSSPGRDTEETRIKINTVNEKQKHKQKFKKAVETKKNQPHNMHRAREKYPSEQATQEGISMSCGAQPRQKDKGEYNKFSPTLCC